MNNEAGYARNSLSRTSGKGSIFYAGKGSIMIYLSGNGTRFPSDYAVLYNKRERQ